MHYSGTGIFEGICGVDIEVEILFNQVNRGDRIPKTGLGFSQIFVALNGKNIELKGLFDSCHIFVIFYLMKYNLDPHTADQGLQKIN